ncbi:hypothetical protein VMT65_29075 [Nocardia sp. CDC153]|uniref:hypothetical protein n=1 Tax=Nocardia sp. CDC153 TaxID=3112167 RepID=UPI002DB64A1C|nr:hypothetical protein [Nocardia sp. CDC153]MEC3957119.1 hypothetical protein [Nocardia sp. CDC153]
MSSRRHRSVSAVGIALLTAAVVLSGCAKDRGDNHDAPRVIDTGNSGGTKVDPSLTESTARDRLNAYLLESLQGLPPGVSYSIASDNQYLGNMHTPSLTVPCDEHGNGSEVLQLSYWIIGVPAGQNTQYFDLIRNAWTARGWTLQQDADSRWAPVHTPDGYSLVLQYAPAQDHSLSVTAGSPCFPKAAGSTAAPQPTEIKRP